MTGDGFAAKLYTGRKRRRSGMRVRINKGRGGGSGVANGNNLGRQVEGCKRDRRSIKAIWNEVEVHHFQSVLP